MGGLLVNEPIARGVVDWDAFENHPDKICYIPEYAYDSDDYCTRNSILELCDGDELKARMIMEGCTWEHPGTALDQWNQWDEDAYQELKAAKSNNS